MRKTIAMLLAVVLVVACVTPCLAAEAVAYDKMTTEELAYCDLDSAPNDLVRRAILNARETIIYSKSWTVDGAGWLVHADGTKETLPEFSDLFPDWDLPVREPTPIDENQVSPTAILFYGQVNLLHPSETSNTRPFYRFQSDATQITLFAVSIPGASYNAGITNLNTGMDVVHATYMNVKDHIEFKPIAKVTYGARASTYSTTGYAVIEITDEMIS